MIAIDTNVFVYAHDDSSPTKKAIARELLDNLPSGVMLWQVVCEFLNASRKLVPKGSSPSAAFERLGKYLAAFPLILPTPALLPHAERLMTAHHFSSGMP